MWPYSDECVPKYLSVLSYILGVVILGGCAINPVSGRPDVVLTSVAQERTIGLEESQKIEKTMGLVNDPTLTGYVDQVGQRLAKHSPRQDVAYHFHVVEMVEPNAFALPGGYVYVSRGLLTLLNSEDELANVMGHEIGHVAARHAVQRMTAAVPLGILTGITSFATGIVSSTLGKAVSDVGGFANSAILAPYGRGQEREADEVGLAMAARSGWNPKAMSTMLRTLEREQTFERGAPGKTSFLNTHPSTPEREADTATHAATVTRAPRNPIAPTHADFLAHLEGLLIGANPAHGVFVDNRFLHPDLDFTLNFPNQWKTQNTPEVVVAASPDSKSYTVLRIVGHGDDPMDAVRALEVEAKVSLSEQTEQLKIGKLPAARLKGKGGGFGSSTGMVVTWIAYQGNIYEIMAVCPGSTFDAYQPIFIETANSFRTLNPSERGSIKETRIHIVRAQKGETLHRLLGRTGSMWSVEKAAIANGLSSATLLTEGHQIKVAIEMPYSSR